MSGQDEDRHPEILKLLRSVPELADAGDIAVEPLTGVQSLNNTSWIVTTRRSRSAAKFVLRLPTPDGPPTSGSIAPTRPRQRVLQRMSGSGPKSCSATSPLAIC